MKVAAALVLATLLVPMQAKADDAAAPLPARDTRWYLRLGGAIDTASLPRTAPGVSFGFDARRGALAARGVSSLFRAEDGVSLFDTMGMICALVPIAALDLGPCGGGGLGVLRSASSATLRAEGVAVTRLDLTLGTLIVLSADAGVVMDPWRASLPDVSFRASVVAFRASLVVLVRQW